MGRFLSPNLISTCFDRLLPKERGGKKHLERTSILLYFLAFDAACKNLDTNILDFTPRTSRGSRHRKQFQIEFERLVVLKKARGNLKQINELGKVTVNGTKPEQRISSNFFSVPMKKAADKSGISVYPSRPKAPVFAMGKSATDINWGIKRHDNWKASIPAMLSGLKSSTPNTDLILFSIRAVSAQQNCKDIYAFILEAMGDKFTDEICEYFCNLIKKEKVLAKHLDNTFTAHYESFVGDAVNPREIDSQYASMTKNEVIERAKYLENLLRQNNVKIPQ